MIQNLSLIILLFVSTFSFQKGECYIAFSKIDNQVNIFIEDELVYQSGVIDGNPDMDLKVSLVKFLKKGNNDLRIELYNGSGDGFLEFDEHWEIYYEIFQDGKPIDYMFESSNNGKPGLSFTMEHSIFVN